MADPVGLRDVCSEELDDIKKRREKAGLSSEDLSSNLVGLALSGGALRSASFALGFVQALQRTGMWRFVDYLSTVSGGGYIGSFLTSSTLKQKKSPSKNDQPLNDLHSDKQLPRVLRFIYGGRCLLSPWRLANSYLFGLVAINLAILSGAIAVCSLIAYLWRCLDYPFISDRLGMLIVESDYHRAFWPFYFFAIAWLVAWGISLFQRSDDAQGNAARHLLVVTVASLLIGIAILFGNGDIAGWENILTGKNFSFGGKAWGPILALVIGGLLPFLSPKRLLKSGLNPEKEWERYVFAIASTALLVGLPLVIVGSLASENISGYNTDPRRPMVRSDINNWPNLCALLKKQDEGGKKPSESVKWFQSALDDHLTMDLSETESTKLKEILNDPDEEKNRLAKLDTYRTKLQKVLAVKASDTKAENSIKTEFEKVSSRPSFRGYLDVAVKLQKSEGPEDPENELATLVAELIPLEKTEQEEHLSVENLSELATRLSALERERQVASRAYFRANKSERIPVISYLQQCIEFVTIWETDNKVNDYWSKKKKTEDLEDVVCSRLNLILQDVDVLNRLLAQEKELPKKETGDGVDKAANGSTKRIATLMLQSDLSGLSDPLAIAELNRLFLEREFPNIFRERSQIRRLVSIYADQKTRLAWFATSAIAFLLAGMWIDLNGISPHRYYRDRLANAFIVARTAKSPSIPLSEMDTAEYGGPYHLMSASVSRQPENLDSQTATYPDDEEYDRCMDSFLFSRMYCGSELTGYLDTASYEHSVVGYANRIDLAEATAISGAALSPDHVRNKLLAFLMLVLNLNMGQWIPNPSARRPRYRPRVFNLLAHLWQRSEDRPYCYVSDGGHSENLGLTQLMKRRCKLIIVADASFDPKHQFGDLSRAIRIARIHAGVKLLAIDKDPNGHDREFDLSDLKLDSQGNCERHFVLARIRYPNDEEGLLLYFKPSFDGDESPDLVQFRKQSKEFPHEPTSDQLFEEAQVESYRYLGYHIGMRLQNLLPREFRPGELWDYGADVNASRLVEWFISNRRRTHGSTADVAITNPATATTAELRTTRTLAKKLIGKMQKDFPEPADIRSERFQKILSEEEDFRDVKLVEAVTAVQCAVLDKGHQTVTNREYCVWLMDAIEADDQIPTNLDETIQILLKVAQPGHPDRVRQAAIASLAIFGRGKHHRAEVMDALIQLADDKKASIRLSIKNALSNLRHSTRKPR